MAWSEWKNVGGDIELSQSQTDSGGDYSYAFTVDEDIDNGIVCVGFVNSKSGGIRIDNITSSTGTITALSTQYNNTTSYMHGEIVAKIEDIKAGSTITVTGSGLYRTITFVFKY